MKRTLLVALCSGLLGLLSCGKKPVSEAPPPPVTFATAEAENVPLTISTFGNCVTIAAVTLQPQVSGTLLRYAVAEGAMVKKGDLVAEIDPAPFQASVQQAQGSLDSAKAQLANAQVTLERQQELYKTKTVDLADLQTAEANQLQAQGDVETAEGQLANAKINLGYCTITSPIDGKTGIYEVDAGNLVTANNTKLINIQTIDPIYVDFTISENDFNTVREYFNVGHSGCRSEHSRSSGQKTPRQADIHRQFHLKRHGHAHAPRNLSQQAPLCCGPGFSSMFNSF